jgi:VWFA-related protein
VLVAGLFAQEPRFRATVPLVIAPTTVTDHKGNFVDGLTEKDFLLYDNHRLQEIRVDVHFFPISLVIAVQSSSLAAPALLRIRKIGSLIEPLVIGERGEAAVFIFDSQVDLIQDFTSDERALKRAFQSIRPGDGGSRMVDAVTAAVRLLSKRPAERRRVLLLISETRDRTSEGKLEDAVTLAQLENVTVYPVTYSAFLTGFTAKPEPSALEAGGGGINLVAIIAEIARLAQTNAGEALSKYTGGRHLSFLKQRSLEQAISRIGEELHSQYLLSFTPSAREEGAFHEIEVKVKDRPEVSVRTRPGYWLGTAR